VDGDDESGVPVHGYALQSFDNSHSSGGVETCERTGGEGDGGRKEEREMEGIRWRVVNKW
jgi:hypothetical protein